MVPWVVGTQEQAALSLSPQPVLQPPCASGGCQADVKPPSWIKDLPWLPPAHSCLASEAPGLASPAAPLPEPKHAWGRSARNGGAAALCLVGKPMS